MAKEEKDEKKDGKKKTGFLKRFANEFKEFINRGNVVDMAVGVVIGAAFSAIVDSFVSDLISPIIGIIFKADFSDVSVTIRGSEIMFGSFITAVIDFLIIALVLFFFVKLINKMRNIKKKEPEAPTTKKCPYCKSEIAIDATRCPNCTSQLEIKEVKLDK